MELIKLKKFLPPNFQVSVIADHFRVVSFRADNMRFKHCHLFKDVGDLDRLIFDAEKNLDFSIGKGNAEWADYYQDKINELSQIKVICGNSRPLES
ncbi:MAG: hypothetical protein FWE31_01770 [Firmicutes bacterium]|nr:hypothetical protein [Bacillota bacterium]